jgi:dCTP diphosphatase
VTTVEDVLTQLRAFVAARDWEQFHSPKNLAAGLVIEAAEVQELFLWLGDGESRSLDESRLARLQDEIGDVQLFLLNLADKFGLDPLQCALRKLELNDRKYPADRVRGSAKKYNEY